MVTVDSVSTARPRVPLAQTAIYFGCFTLVGVLSAILGPSLHSFSVATGSTAASLGVLFTADSFGSVCGSLLAGQLLHRIPPHRQAIGGLVVIAAVVTLIPTVDSLLLLPVVWWALGLAKTFLIVTVNTLLIWVRRDRVGPYMNVADFFLGFGSLLMPMIIAQSLLSTGRLHLSYWFAALFTVALIVPLWLVPSPEMRRETTKGDKPGRHRMLLPIAVILFFYVGAEISFAGWMPSYTLSRGLAETAAGAAYFTSIFWISVTVGRLLWLPATKYIKPQWVLSSSAVLCVAMIGLIWMWPDSLAVTVTGTIGFGFAMSSIFPSAFTWLARTGEVTGKVSGWCLFSASIGAMFFPLLIGHSLL